MATSKPVAQTKMPSLSEMVEDLLARNFILTASNCPFEYHRQEGSPNVMIVAGDNATGKSFLTSVISARAFHAHGVSPMVVSMAARTDSGMMRSFTYGPEKEFATGSVSLNVTFKALENIPSRLSEKNGRALVILDEPDVGLSESYAYAFGQEIANRLNALPARGWGVLLVTHSRELVRGLSEGLQKKPSFIHTGTKLSLDQWLEKIQRKPIKDLLKLPERNIERFRKVGRIIDELNEGKKAKPSPRKRKPSP